MTKMRQRSLKEYISDLHEDHRVNIEYKDLIETLEIAAGELQIWYHMAEDNKLQEIAERAYKVVSNTLEKHK